MDRQTEGQTDRQIDRLKQRLRRRTIRKIESKSTQKCVCKRALSKSQPKRLFNTTLFGMPKISKSDSEDVLQKELGKENLGPCRKSAESKHFSTPADHPTTIPMISTLTVFILFLMYQYTFFFSFSFFFRRLCITIRNMR